MTSSEPAWFTSSYSSNGGNCVEVAGNLAAVDAVPVRDSKDPGGPVLVFPVKSWANFVSAVRGGDFCAV
ncbi:DUF397 domain-containing protein [Kitasatospora sp. NPDC048538]|uniref:DUF397 domain-containing protein n=1 Tax=unclassified Kitasatospora TaxID=2633591 RepID=UPI0033EBA9B9